MNTYFDNKKLPQKCYKCVKNDNMTILHKIHTNIQQTMHISRFKNSNNKRQNTKTCTSHIYI